MQVGRTTPSSRVRSARRRLRAQEAFRGQGSHTRSGGGGAGQLTVSRRPLRFGGTYELCLQWGDHIGDVGHEATKETHHPEERADVGDGLRHRHVDERLDLARIGAHSVARLMNR